MQKKMFSTGITAYTIQSAHIPSP